MKSFLQFGPFMGVVFSLDPEMIPDNSAADLRNVLVEDGRITPRYGYRNISAAPANFSQCYGFDYVQGVNSSYAIVEEYMSFEKHISGGSSTLYPYRLTVDGSSRVQLTGAGGANVVLTAPTYGDQPGIRSFSYNGYAYSISPNDAGPLFRHTIGLTNDFTNMNPPAAPTVKPLVEYYWGGNDAAPQTANLLYWSVGGSLGSLAVNFNGDTHLETSTFASTSDGTLTLMADGYGTETEPITDSFTIDLTATNGPGAQDFTYTDRMIFAIQAPTLGFDPNGFLVTLIDGAGNNYQGVTSTVGGEPGNSSPPGSSGKIAANVFVVVDWPNKSPRTDFSAIQKIEIQWVRNGSANPNNAAFSSEIFIDPVWLGPVDTRALDQGGNPVPLEIGYTYYSATTGLESEISPTITLDPTKQVGGWIYDPFQNEKYYLNARPKLYLTKDVGVSFDDYRLYGRRSTDTDWFLIYDPGLVTQPTPEGAIVIGATGLCGSNKTFNGVTYDASVNLLIDWTELSASSVFTLGGSPFKGLISACPYKGWVVWGFQGGYANLQHSTIGNELALYNNADLTQINPSNSAAPANFTLADNGSDDPVAMFPCGQSLFILGYHGVYAQTGYSPTTMSPPMKLPTSFGCSGQYACCLFHDEIGNPAVAYVSRYGEGVYLAQEDLYYLNEVHYKQTELTVSVRGSIQSFLLGGGATLADIRMGWDQVKDALWILAGNRAMVLRRQSMLDQMRHWEFYEYSFGDGQIAFTSFDTRNRSRWMRTTGELDENEWDSVGQQWITGVHGVGRDGCSYSGSTLVAGSSLSQPYYWTKKMTSPQRTRVRFVRVDREDLSDQPSVQCISTREANTVQCASGKYFVRFPLFQQGNEHQFQILPVEGSASISRVLVEMEGPLGDRWRS